MSGELIVGKVELYKGIVADFAKDFSNPALIEKINNAFLHIDIERHGQFIAQYTGAGFYGEVDAVTVGDDSCGIKFADKENWFDFPRYWRGCDLCETVKPGMCLGFRIDSANKDYEIFVFGVMPEIADEEVFAS